MSAMVDGRLGRFPLVGLLIWDEAGFLGFALVQGS